jgi:hypothetical protein
MKLPGIQLDVAGLHDIETPRRILAKRCSCCCVTWNERTLLNESCITKHSTAAEVVNNTDSNRMRVFKPT